MFRQRLRIAGRIGLVIAIMVSSVVTVMQWWDNPEMYSILWTERTGRLFGIHG